MQVKAKIEIDDPVREQVMIQNPGICNLQDFDRDKAACEQEAKKVLAKKGQANDSCAVLEETKRCLETRKGWVQK